MFTARAQLTNIVTIKNVGLQIGEVDGFRAGSLYPAPRADLMGYKGRPDRFSGRRQIREISKGGAENRRCEKYLFNSPR